MTDEKRTPDEAWSLDEASGELTLRTGVTGRGARMGHRLTIAMTRWRARVDWVDGNPLAAELQVDVDSLEVLRGEGGLKPLSGPEKVLVRSNALKSLSANKFPRIRFSTTTIDKTAEGYRLTGELEIHGTTRNHVIDLCTSESGEEWRMSAESGVRQSDFGVKPFSLFMGSLQVADEVTVSFAAARPKTSEDPAPAE